MSQQLTPEMVIEAARKKWPDKSNYFTLEYSSCRFWNTVSLRIADCGNAEPKPIFTTVNNSLLDVLAHIEAQPGVKPESRK